MYALDATGHKKGRNPCDYLGFRPLSDYIGHVSGGDGQNRTADLWVMNPSL